MRKKSTKKQWYSDFCLYNNKEEKEEAYQYLKLWKKFFIAKLPYFLLLKDEKWTENKELPSVSLKLCMEEKNSVKKKIKKNLKKVEVSKLSYDDVIYDIDGWADAKKYASSPFDLVLIKTDKKEFNGWYTGNNWYGLRLNEDEEVLYWKKRKEVY